MVCRVLHFCGDFVRRASVQKQWRLPIRLLSCEVRDTDAISGRCRWCVGRSLVGGLLAWKVRLKAISSRSKRLLLVETKWAQQCHHQS